MTARRLYPIVALAGLLLVTRAAAHEIPSDITVQALVKPEGQRLRLIVRVPLRAMRDVNFPTEGPGYLILRPAESAARGAAMLWIGQSIDLYENSMPVAVQEPVAARISLPSNRSFASYEEALAHVTGPPLPDSERLTWDAALLDILFEYPIRSQRSNFSVRLHFERLAARVTTVLRFVTPGGQVRAFEYAGDPGVVRLDPRWHQAAARFVKLGFVHILDGTDHLLFLLCLVIPIRRFRTLVLIVTSFTIAHSITLIASAVNLAPDGLWFPPLVEMLIAASIVYMALENILGSAGAPESGGLRRRWLAAFAFGLVHGFGFSFALRESLQFAGSHLLTSLVSFNVGVELGQLAALAILVPLLQMLFRSVVAERIGTIVLSAFVAHTAWHWTTERWARLREYGWPASMMEPATLASAARWLLVIVLMSFVWWGVSAWWKRGQATFPASSERKS